jgi:hypothetical protein
MTTKYYPYDGMTLDAFMGIMAEHDDRVQFVGGDVDTVTVYFERDGFVAEVRMKIISPMRMIMQRVVFADNVTIQPDIDAVRRAFIERGMEVTK